MKEKRIKKGNYFDELKARKNNYYEVRKNGTAEKSGNQLGKTGLFTKTGKLIIIQRENLHLALRALPPHLQLTKSKRHFG